MLKSNVHERIVESIQTMLIDTTVGLPYYGNFNLFVNFHERKDIPTCGVNMTTKGMNFYFNSEFLNGLSQKEINFIVLHEDFHLLWNHPKRTITGQYDHKMSNIVQDMIINHIIWQDISHDFVEIPKDKNGKNMALFVPKEYMEEGGKLIFESLYEWFRDKYEDYKKNKCSSCDGTGEEPQEGQNGQNGDQGENSGQQGNQDGDGQGEQDGDGNGCGKCQSCNGTGKKDQGKGSGSGNGSGEYGQYGQDPNSDGGTIETWSLDKLFEDLDSGKDGEYLDSHMGDEVSEDMREGMVKDAMERLSGRGLASGNIETTLNKLRKKRKDYLKHIKRSVANVIMGTKKTRTIKRPNRKGINGVKGFKKIKTAINVILDTSGSMGNTFEKVLSFIYRSDIDVNMVQADTEVKWVDKFMDNKKIERMKISGHGGTVLQPAVNFVSDNFNQYSTCILTDGYCDSLDLSKLGGRVLIISIGVEVPITRSNGKVKQICVELDD